MVKCECGVENPDAAKFCQGCGASLIKDRETISDKLINQFLMQFQGKVPLKY